MFVAARKTPVSADVRFASESLRTSARGRINLRTRTYDVIRRIYLSYFGTRRVYSDGTGTVRNMGRYLRYIPLAAVGCGGRKYVNLCASARSETSFYLSFHGMDVEGRGDGRAHALFLLRAIVVSYHSLAHLVSSHLISSRSLRSMVSMTYRFSRCRCRIRKRRATPCSGAE